MQEQQIAYATYPEYKFVKGLEVMLPIEIPENIMVQIASTIYEQTDVTKTTGELVTKLRKMLDENFGKYWHVFAGKNFGAYAVHDRFQFAFFKYKTNSFLVYKTTY